METVRVCLCGPKGLLVLGFYDMDYLYYIMDLRVMITPILLYM